MRFPTALRRVPAANDLALAAGVVAFLVVVTPQVEPETGDRPVDALAYALVALAGASLAARRRRPLAVVVVVTAALTVYLARDYPGGPVFVTALVAFYSLATARDRRRALLVAAAASGWLVAVGLALATGPGLVHLVFAGWAAAAVFLGDAVQSRRRHLVALEERARDLEQRREQETARRVAEERLRIARDLHDSVAHSMTAINVQAGAAVHVVDRRPEQAREALVAIQHQSRQVLEELSALLGVLRHPGDGVARAPTPGLADLDELVRSTRGAGLDVRLCREGPPVDVTPAVAVAAYRIVQESLTNVVRHAGPRASAVVTVTGAADGGLAVEIVDDGVGAGPGPRGRADATGVGIVGMRERAESTGGTLDVGPPPGGGGFAVRARWAGRR